LKEKLLFIALAVLSLLPMVTAPWALLAGILFSLLFSHPFPIQNKFFQPKLLQFSVASLGAGINLNIVLEVGLNGFWQTLISISGTLMLAFLLSKWLKTESHTSTLIAVGTAICGGSAIAAVAPVIGAKSESTSISLAVVFLLNSVALFLFPLIGHALNLSVEQFGMWSALAIHDTSSVVGAALEFSKDSVETATTLKLARALWIVPLTLVLSRFVKTAQNEKVVSKVPWFILAFLCLSALFTFIPQWNSLANWLVAAAKRTLVFSLFLIGTSVSKDSLKLMGFKPLLFGLVVFVLVASASLLLIALP
jgi:uncharacterized integral membrane protein (TIGR00698 family)